LIERGGLLLYRGKKKKKLLPGGGGAHAAWGLGGAGKSSDRAKDHCVAKKKGGGTMRGKVHFPVS